jgi:asparagine synthase (glutamine-hydrolysing)
MGMMNSIESRFPFLDENLLSFSMNLPTKFKIGRSRHFHNYKHPFLIDKAIVRSLADKKLPKHLANKKKKGFPVSHLYQVRVSPKFFKNGTFADLFKLNEAQLDYMQANTSAYHMGLLTSFEIWGKLFVEQLPVDLVTQKVHQHVNIK